MTREKILVIKLGALGDFLYAMGACAAIRLHHKNAHITLLTTKPYVTLARQCGYFDDILIDPKPKFNPLSWMQLRRQLNAQEFTRVYDLQNNDRTARYFHLFSPRPEWAGVVDGATFRNTDPDRKKFHSFLSLKKILSHAGIADVTLDPLLWMQADMSSLHLKQPYVLLVPGSSPDRPNKRLPAAIFRGLIPKLVDAGLHVYLIGADAEKEIAEEIADNLPVVNLIAKTTLAQLVELSRHAALAIGNDTGPMHMISMTNCPSIFFYLRDESNVTKHGPQARDTFSFEADDLNDIDVNELFDKARAMARF